MKLDDFSITAPPPPGDSSWDKLAAAHRHAHSGPESAHDAAPFGFARMIAAQAMGLRRPEPLACWTRWSFRAAWGGMVTAAMVALLSQPPVPQTSLLAAPALEIPHLSSL